MLAYEAMRAEAIQSATTPRSVSPLSCPLIPQLAFVAMEPELATQLDDAYYHWYYELNATAFDIDDADVEQAEATWVRTRLGEPELRLDDARFYTVTTVSSGAWQWRRVERSEGDPSPAALDLLERYRKDGADASRSERIGLVATSIKDDTFTWNACLENHSPGGEEYGPAFLSAGWLLVSWTLNFQPQLTRLHEPDVYQDAFRFGIALRDAQIAYDSDAQAD
jgi:hypothetical protein